MTSNTQADSFFGVDLDLVNVGIEVRVNDIPIYEDIKAGQLTVELPCPDSIVDGYNSLTVLAKPPKRGKEILENYEAGAYVNARIFRQDNDGEKQYLAEIDLRLDSAGELAPIEESTLSERTPELVRLGNKVTSFTAFAKIKSPFPSWAWQAGKKIEHNQESFDSLMQAYREVYVALEEKDQARLKTLYTKRAEEIAIAYNLDGVDAGHKKISTGKDALNPSLKLLDFLDKNKLHLQVIGNKRLARAVTISGNQPIAYIQENPRLLHIHKFMFYKNEKNQWVMIR
ncbi:hypothetical protein [Teredinibacter franksiae]|uniref:hypothetical protein n=1 Tax=Teredinibacter franksiae TaxID=2761453 RepID=UPI001624B5B6|nr:hypothetical protein [Teredinibacter franksiae]